ncbi:MAG: oligosaccharide flippase family protein [Marinomonas sp.]|uniref:lipopolysaccharide biosynthesis protein n=1 Tax=Marinomonas sp. TaxID=1904862 RepID=UPI003C731ECA
MSRYSLIKSASWYTVSKILVMSLNFVSIPVFTHLLTTSEYGEVSVYTIWIGILTPFIGLGLHLSISRAKIEFESNYIQYVSSIIAFLGLLFFLFLFLFFIFKEQFFSVTKIPSKLALLLFTQVLMCLFISVSLGMFQFEYKYKLVSILNLLRAVLSVSFSFVLVLVFNDGMRVEGKIIGVFVVDVILGLSLASYILFKGKVFFDYKYWKFGLVYSVPFIFGSLSYILNSQFDRLLINEYVGSSETGIYSFAYSIGMLLLLLAIAVKQALNPWIYDRLNNDDFYPVKSVYVQYIHIFSIVSMLLLYVTPELVMLLSDKAFWSGAKILPWIVLGAYLQVLILNESETQMFLKKTATNSLIIVLGAVINIILNYFYIPDYGALGAAITTVITYLVMFLLVFYVNLKIFKFSLVKVKCYAISIFYVCFFSVVFFYIQDYFILRLGVFLLNSVILLRFLLGERNKFISSKASV